jgi:sugar phosphate isomerase/epimerase
MLASRRRRFVLTGYSVPHAMGYLPLANGQANPQPWTAWELIERARRLGLQGIEIPLAAKVPSFEGRVVELPAVEARVADELREADMSLIADFGILVDSTPREIAEYLELSRRLGARVVRAVISNLLCGDRRPIPGGWRRRLEQTAHLLREVLPIAEQLGLCLAVENHQDASTDDLLWLIEAVDGHPAFGVTLDTGNPLAVGEDPMAACVRLGRWIRHLHLKDYTIHFAAEGYRLVRCPAGRGVVDFPRILEMVGRHAVQNEVIGGVEIAAHSARTIPVLDDGWWTSYPRSAVETLLPVLRTLWQRGLPMDHDYLTVWERGGSTPDVIGDEWHVVQESAHYFLALGAQLAEPSPTSAD